MNETFNMTLGGSDGELRVGPVISRKNNRLSSLTLENESVEVVNFSQEVLKRMGEEVRRLAVQFEDVLTLRHEEELARLRRDFTEQELALRSQNSALQERLANATLSLQTAANEGAARRPSVSSGSTIQSPPPPIDLVEDQPALVMQLTSMSTKGSVLSRTKSAPSDILEDPTKSVSSQMLLPGVPASARFSPQVSREVSRGSVSPVADHNQSPPLLPPETPGGKSVRYAADAEKSPLSSGSLSEIVAPQLRGSNRLSVGTIQSSKADSNDDENSNPDREKPPSSPDTFSRATRFFHATTLGGTSRLKMFETLKSKLRSSRISKASRVSEKNVDQVYNFEFELNGAGNSKVVSQSSFMLHPSSKIRTGIDLFSVVFLTWDALTFPFVLAFEPPTSAIMMSASILAGLFWLFDMVLSMYTGYYDNGVLVLSRSSVIKRYLRRWFIPDLIVNGADWMNLIVELLETDGVGANLDLLRLVKLNRVLRLSRAFRVIKVYQHLKNIGHSAGAIYLSDSSNMLIKLFKYILMILFVNHCVACTWYSVGTSFTEDSDTTANWLEHYTMTLQNGEERSYADMPTQFQYLMSLHYAVCNTILGNLSVNPTNSFELAFTICCLVVGFVVSSVMVSSLSSWLVERQMLKQGKNVMLSTLRRYLRENGVSIPLANRIDNHIKYQIRIDRRLREDQVQGLDLLSQTLRAELRQDMWGKTLLLNGPFRMWSSLEEKVTFDLCLSAVTPKYLDVGAELFTPGTKAVSVLVVIEGTMDYRRTIDSKFMKKRFDPSFDGPVQENVGSQTISKDTWLGEYAMWVPWIYKGTANASTSVELLEISPTDIESILSKYPKIARISKNYRQAVQEHLSILDVREISDINMGIEHVTLIMSMNQESRFYVSLPALRALKQRNAWRALVSDFFYQLEHELAQGTHSLILDPQGNVQRISRLVSLRITREDGKQFMVLSRNDGTPLPAPSLLSATLCTEEPELGLSKILSGELEPFASHLTFGQSTRAVSSKLSKTYASLYIQNVRITNIFSTTMSGEVALGQRLPAVDAFELYQHFELEEPLDLKEVYLVNTSLGMLHCAWLTYPDEDLPEAELSAANARGSRRSWRPGLPTTSRDSARLTTTTTTTTTNTPAASSHHRATLGGPGGRPVSAGHSGSRSDSVLAVAKSQLRVSLPPRLLEPDDSSLRGVELLRTFLAGTATDWHRARLAATRILEPDYTCEDFFSDIVAAFPELGLYAAGANFEMQGASPRASADDEYQRTIGAFFAFFWIMRLDLEGAESFSFGLNDEWKPRLPPQDGSRLSSEMQKRVAFRENADWAAMQKLLVDANILRNQSSSASEARHDLQRTLAMLSLTAYHDIMKVHSFRPVVQNEHGMWNGFKPGEVVDDHDAALGYILEFYPDLLPSFHGLPTSAQRSVRLTQCKMDYNMGWLVQAEAPPGALLTTLRKTVLSGNVSQQDIMFYFVHWFTDLSGAFPTPLGGSEKFVLNFPMKVLGSFASSFSIISDLGNASSETEVYESYIRWRWESHKPALGPLPQGVGAVAKIRLVLMAQGNSKMFLNAFSKLQEADRKILCEELARTGCEGQRYQHDVLKDGRGPAFLVYYAPAFLQKAGLLDPNGALSILAEILRQARNMWPLKTAASGVNVTLKIDALKAETVAGCRSSHPEEAWVLEKLNDKTAIVSRVQLPKADETPDVDWSQRAILNFARYFRAGSMEVPGLEI